MVTPVVIHFSAAQIFFRSALVFYMRNNLSPFIG